MAGETRNPNIHLLWPIPILRKKFEQHAEVNPALVQTVLYPLGGGPQTAGPGLYQS